MSCVVTNDWSGVSKMTEFSRDLSPGCGLSPGEEEEDGAGGPLWKACACAAVPVAARAEPSGTTGMVQDRWAVCAPGQIK